MCANYVPVTQSDWLLRFFGVERDRASHELPADLWPLGLAPIIRLAQPGSGHRLIVQDAQFGLVPQFQTELAKGRATYNARSETVAVKPSFRESWRRGWRCVIPAHHFYENSYENPAGKAERWQIQRPGGAPLAFAGIWREWTGSDGQVHLTFSMLTRNADHHPLMSRMHSPADEKRMPVILEPDQHLDWLTCPVAEAQRFFEPWHGELEGFPKPKAPRAAPVKKAADKPVPPQDPGLF